MRTLIWFTQIHEIYSWYFKGACRIWVLCTQFSRTAGGRTLEWPRATSCTAAGHACSRGAVGHERGRAREGVSTPRNLGGTGVLPGKWWHLACSKPRFIGNLVGLFYIAFFFFFLSFFMECIGCRRPWIFPVPTWSHLGSPELGPANLNLS